MNEARDIVPLPTPLPAGVRRAAALVAFTLFAGGAAYLTAQGWRLGVLFLIGGLLGVTIYHAGLGFTAQFRKLFVTGETTGITVQILMLAVASLLFAPVLASGTVLGREVVGALAPLGPRVAIGAFMFGIGMQLGCACGSGTLTALGAGSLRMIITLVAFCAGGFWATLDMGFWAGLPTLGPVSLGAELGWGRAVLLQLAFLGALALALRRWGARMPRSAAGPAAPRTLRPRRPKERWLRGPWPLAVGALALAGLNFATLLVAGHPWSITWGFTLWAAKVAAALGWDPAGTAFWNGAFQRAALERGVLADITSVMDIAILLGALGAAVLGGRYAPRLQLTFPIFLSLVIGGLLMGYGARLAFGCNIGAFFSGVASFSLHGWLWIVCALAGTAVAVRLRPLFGLANETPPPGSAATAP